MQFLKKKYFLISLLLSCCIVVLILINFFLSFSSKKQYISKTQKPYITRTPSSVINYPPPYAQPNMMPRGTQLMFSPQHVSQYRALSQYQKQAIFKNYMLNYIIHKYGLADRSRTNPKKDTYFIPLSVYDNDDTIDPQTVMVDIHNISQNPTPPAQNIQEVLDSDKSAKQLFTTKNAFDIDTSPSPPKEEYTPIIPKKNKPTTQNNNSCEFTQNKTQAKSICIDCLNLPKQKTTKFLQKLTTTVKVFAKDKKFNSIIEKFCSTCHGIDIKDFKSYLETRATKTKIPAPILWSIMLRESGGDCKIPSANKNEKSMGLFQLNTANSTKLQQCDKNIKNIPKTQMKSICERVTHTNKYTNRDAKKGLCIQNPYCNLESALSLIKEKWSAENKPTKRPNKKWLDMTPQQRNNWRSAIIAYNGTFYIDKATDAITQNAQVVAQKHDINSWELKRMFSISYYLKANTTRALALIHNLAYAERIAGREIKNGLPNSSICQWMNFNKNNKNLTCKKQ